YFFQAEDGIRDRNVTGVQTCALPILVPDSTYCAATSGRERFMMVLEKKVSTKRIARKMMAKVLTHSRRFVLCIGYHTSLGGLAPGGAAVHVWNLALHRTGVGDAFH